MREAATVEVFSAAIAVPDSDTFVMKQVGIGRTRNEPQQLLHHTCTCNLHAIRPACFYLQLSRVFSCPGAALDCAMPLIRSDQ